MALFNLNIINTYIDAYIKIRRHKNKGQATDDEIDRKCVEIKQRFADASKSTDPHEWVKLFSYLGGIADGSQNNKRINQMPSFIRMIADSLPTTQYTETQSDLSQAIWALIHYLHRVIFKTTCNAGTPEQKQQADIRTAIATAMQQLGAERDAAFAAWNNSFLEEKASDEEASTKKESYLDLALELIYLGDRSHLCVVIAECYQTYDRPERKRLGQNSTDPMQDNHRLPSVLHEDYDRFYVRKIMLEEDRNLLESYEEPVSNTDNTVQPPQNPSPAPTVTASDNTNHNASPRPPHIVTRDEEHSVDVVIHDSDTSPTSSQPDSAPATSSPRSTNSTEVVQHLLALNPQNAHGNGDTKHEQKEKELLKPLPTLGALRAQGLTKHEAQLKLTALKRQAEAASNQHTGSFQQHSI